MLHSLLRSLASLALVAVLGGTAAAQNTVDLHVGRTDPLTEGWVNGYSGPFNYTSPAFQGGIGPVTTGGIDAWRIFDVVNASSGANVTTYDRDFPYNTPTGLPLNSRNWLFSANVNPEAGSNPGNVATLYNSMFWVKSWAQNAGGIGYGHQHFVAFERLADGTNRIHWELTGANVFTRNAIVPGGFIWVELFYRSVTNKARLFVNGVELDSDVTPYYGPYADNSVGFGDYNYSLGGSGGSQWSIARYERGPNPIELQGANCGRVSYCPPTANSFSATGATLAIAGSTSLSTGGLMDLTGMGIPPGKSGTLAYGTTQTAQPFGAGTLCIQTPQRLQVVTASQLGTISFALNITNPAYAFTAGSTWNFQYIFRDPIPGVTSLNTSSALAVTFCP